jgi:hypothetical protein
MICISYNVRSAGPPTVGRFFFEKKEAGSNYQGVSFESFKITWTVFFFSLKKKTNYTMREGSKPETFIFYFSGVVKLAAG